VRIEAWVDIAADSPATWSSLTDYAARERSSDVLTGYSIYLQDTDRLCIRWTGSRFGMSLVFHNCYGMNVARTELTHTLDPDRPSDLAYTQGTYKLAPGPKGTRLHYRSETDFGKPMPGFVKTWLGSSGAREYMLDTKKRAEAR